MNDFFTMGSDPIVFHCIHCIREPIEHEYNRAQLQSDFLCARVKDASIK